MKTQMLKITKGALAFFVLALTTAAASATTILYDSFDGTNGTSLAGQTVASYDSGTYSVAPVYTNIVAAGKLVYYNGVAGIGVNNHTQVAIATPNQTSGILTLKADVTVGTAGYVALSFLSSNTSSLFDTSTTLNLLFNSSGNVTLYKHGTATSLFTAAISGFSTTTSYNLELQYNRSEGTANVLLDGVKLNTEPITIGTLNSSTFGAVGMYVRKITGTDLTIDATTFDNFTYAVVPEPKTTALMLGTGLLLAGTTCARTHLRNRSFQEK